MSPIDIERHLSGLRYPAKKDEVIAATEQNDAPQEVIEALQALSDEHFNNLAEVQAALS